MHFSSLTNQTALNVSENNTESHAVQQSSTEIPKSEVLTCQEKGV